jgi:hypothetical protein
MQPSREAAQEAVLVFAIQIEKLLCAALGREWATAGISIESLIAELVARAERAEELAKQFARDGDELCKKLDAAQAIPEGDSFKPIYWWSILLKCANLLGLADDEPIPSGVLRAVEKLVAAQAAHAGASDEQPRAEQVLRRLLAYRCAGSLLYADDGELQDSTARPWIDFKRDSVDNIETKLGERACAAMSAATEQKEKP